MRHVLLITLASLSLAAIPTYAAEQAISVSSPIDNAAYQNAVADARAGRLESALAVLQSLSERYPARQDILGDYLVVLGWAGQDQLALSLMDKVNLNKAPEYVIKGLALSARRQHRYDLAESLYRNALLRFPASIDLEIGLAYAFLGAEKIEAATTQVAKLRASYPRNVDVLLAFAEVASVRHDYFAALEAYQTILSRDPKNRQALRGKVQVLARLGTPQLALELADRNPGLLSATERESVLADQTAHQIRWGAIEADSGRGPSRFAAIDKALAQSDSAGARALDPARTLSPAERQLALDRIGALRERYRMRDAIALYEALAARPEPMPGYAKSAAASAYLYLQQPERARDLYRDALQSDPKNLEAQIGLFYALAESEDHAAALAQIEQTLAATPQWIDAWSPATERDNPAYTRVLSARSMAPLFANRPGEAEERLRELSIRAPYNMDVRTDHASTMRARGWPRAAERELSWVLAVDPENSGALGERAGALLEMRDYRAAQSALAAAQAVDAEDGRVVRAARLQQVHQMRELIIDGTYGRSSGGPTGTQDYAVDAWLFSSPFNDNYRAFAHTFTSQAKFDQGTGKRQRVGAGLEYRSPLYIMRGEVSTDINQNDAALSAMLAYTPDDHWIFRGEYDKSSNLTPLQASLAGIDANRIGGEVVWRAHESRTIAGSIARMDFSDGNRRDTAQARWTERVIAGPIYKLELTGGLYTSRNSSTNTPYFNPSRDFSPTLELANEWIQWRRYTRSFKHRLVLTGGSYSQEGFSTGSLYEARYEQEYAADDRLTLRYGVGHSRHPYDGVQTDRDFAYFYLNARF
ncbi:MAG TPA: poly-beta-1,6 N-acetyl-D-glucosamine export porin PgaA [Rhodocyclaceae bacterium]|nr:poly-beta-1,6 N-acetyl-D-glucosamine export porin PgaA [Rhodocyclaceae bacterium]